MNRAQQVEDSLDEALAETFPASDPPFFIAAGLVGAPPRAGDTLPDAAAEDRADKENRRPL